MRLLYVNGKAVGVTEEVYKAFWQEHEKVKYQLKKQRVYEISQNALEDMGAISLLGYDKSAEACYFFNLRNKALYKAISMLGKDGEDFLKLALGEETERSLAKKYGCSPSTVHRRKEKTRQKMKQIIEKVT